MPNWSKFSEDFKTRSPHLTRIKNLYIRSEKGLNDRNGLGLGQRGVHEIYSCCSVSHQTAIKRQTWHFPRQRSGSNPVTLGRDNFRMEGTTLGSSTLGGCFMTSVCPLAPHGALLLQPPPEFITNPHLSRASEAINFWPMQRQPGGSLYRSARSVRYGCLACCAMAQGNQRGTRVRPLLH